MKMKKLLLTAAIATSFMYACKPNGGGGTTPVPPNETITFSATFARPMAESALGVYAFDTGSDRWPALAEEFATAEITTLLSNSPLTRGGDGKWSYGEPAMEWDGNRKHFFAYGPHASLTDCLTASGEDAVGTPTLTYKIGAGGPHTDVFLALPRLNTMSIRGTDLSLTMRSVMSKISFQLKGGGQKVARIAIRGIIEEGTIALDAEDAETMTWTLTGEITENEHSAKIVFDEGQQYVTATETPKDIMAEGGAIYLLPQNFTYQMRAVVTLEGGEKIGLPIDQTFQIKPGTEYVFDLDLATGNMLDFTDNERAMFRLDRTDLAAAQNVSHAAATSECAQKGFRLPTYNESLAIMAYFSAIGGSNYRVASYWCSTSLADNSGQAMGYDPFRYLTLDMPKAGITAGRCVAANTVSGKKYPYVDTSDPDGPIIVSRDADGGVNETTYWSVYQQNIDTFHENWATTPEHDISTMADRVSRKLQVANADASSDAMLWGDIAAACPAGWRTPTHMELILIYAAGGAQAGCYDTTPAGDSYNPAVTETPLHSAAGFTPFLGEGYWASSRLAGSGGGRSPAYWPFAETSRRLIGDATTQQRLRCVRDVE